MRVLSVLLLLLVPVPSLAQAPDVDTFVNSVRQWGEESNLLNVVNAVRYHGEVAAQAFDRVLKEFESADGPDKAWRMTWLNLVARAFYLERQMEYTETVRGLGILWPDSSWAGTLFESDQPVDTHGQVATKVESGPPDGSPMGHFKEGLAVMQLSVRAGQDRDIPRLAKALTELAQDLEPGHRERMVLEVEALRTASLEGAGLSREAITAGEALATRLTGISDLQTYVHLGLANAARRAALPEKVDALLGSIQVDGNSSDAMAARFIVDSLRFERDYERNPDLSFSQLVSRHQAAWKNLEFLNPNELRPAVGRWVVEAASVWVRAGIGRMLDEVDEFPVYAQAAYLVENDLDVLRRFFRESFDRKVHPQTFADMVRVWNPEFIFGVLDLQLDAVEGWRRGGRKNYAIELLNALEYDFKKLDEMSRELRLTYQLAQIGAQQGASEIGFLQVGNVTVTEALFGRGDFLRVGARYHLERVWSLIPPAGEEVEQRGAALLKEELDRASRLQKEARGGGFLGGEDARWAELDALARLKPAGWRTQAERLTTELLTASTEAGYRPGRIQSLTWSGQLATEAGRKVQARQNLEQAIGLTEKYLQEVGGGPLAAARVRSQFRRAYELLAQLQLRSGQPEEAFTTLARLGEAERAATLDLGAVARQDPQLKAEFERLEGLRQRSRSLEQEKTARTAEGQALEPVEGLLAESRSEFYTALGEIRRKHPEYASFLAVRPVSFSRLQPAVPANTAVVQFFPADDGLYLFVLTSEQLKIKRVQVARQELDRTVTQIRRRIIRSSDQPFPSRGATLELEAEESPSAPGGGAQVLVDELSKLYAWLVEPIEEEIADKEVVAFIPSGCLTYAPLQAMVRRTDGGLEFLIERKQVVTLLKSTDLERLTRPPQKGSGHLVAVGNPDGSLPGAEEEAKELAALYPGSTLWVGDAALPAKLESATDVGYLHLATHGILNGRNPNASYLVMGDDQRLEIPQIAGLGLAGTRLVTLSACETALGEAAEQSSELTTLADAFGFAGCPSVVASLWKVSDRSTRALMLEFYGQLRQGTSLAAGMREAQLQLLRNPETRHPYHWAPFLLIGDWR